MKFLKMQGLGNDYIYLHDPDESINNPNKLSIIMSDRHFGVGGDGLVLILPSRQAEARMRMFNADGSEAEMCGNAIRCVAKFMRDYNLTTKKEFEIETKAGLKGIRIISEEQSHTDVEVNMGPPVITSTLIPVNGAERTIIDEKLLFKNEQMPIIPKTEELLYTAVSMGNPHCVIFISSLSNELVHNLGPLIEKHPNFPKRVNVEFVEKISNDIIKMRVWERGSGETMACGTGACASVVAGRLKGILSPQVTVKLLGGDLSITWNGENEPVYMTGPATTVFQGEWLLDIK